MAANLHIKRQDKIEEFYQKSMQYIKETSKTYLTYSRINELYNIISSLPCLADNILESDLPYYFKEFMDGIPCDQRKNLTIERVKSYFGDVLFRDPITFVLSYRMGSAYGFPEGFQIGTGKIFSYEKMVENGKTNSSEVIFGNPYLVMEDIAPMAAAKASAKV